MGDKKKQIYSALVEGAATGLSDDALYGFVLKQCPKASSKKIVHASLLALTDPDLKDRDILNAIYALAIKHRLSATADNENEEVEAKTPVAEKPKKNAASTSKAAILPLPDKPSKRSRKA